MNDTKQSEQTIEADQKKQFFQEGFATYLDVVSALHLFQTEVANELNEVLEGERDRIKTVMQLEKEIGPINRSVYPSFPDDKWSYDSCDIYATVWLAKPKNCSFCLGATFKHSDSEPKSSLCCAVEVGPQYQRNEWLQIFRNHADLLNEDWGDYAVGLRRPLRSPDGLRQGLETFLGDFLRCIENTQNQSASQGY